MVNFEILALFVFVLLVRLADLHREQGKGGFGDSFGSPCLDLEGFHVSRTNTMNYSSG